MKTTKIEWCDCTINPVVGCTYGCPYCYARKLNDRFGFIEDWSKPQFFPDRLDQLNSKKPKIVFMDSMSDIADWELEWLRETFKAMIKNPQHRYLFLTKRIDEVTQKLLDSQNKSLLLKLRNLGSPFMLGTTATSGKIYRTFMDGFLSIEPLHGPIFVEPIILNEFKWIIIGAETGNRKGKIIPKKEWVDSIVEQAKTYDIPIFMKDSLVPIVGEKNMLREFPENLKMEDTK